MLVQNLCTEKNLCTESTFKKYFRKVFLLIQGADYEPKNKYNSPT